MTSQTATLNKLQLLETLYRHGYRSEFVDRTLDKVIALERAEAHQELMDLEARLGVFEQQYQMASADFYERFHRGELGDDADFFEWSALYEMAEALRQRLQVWHVRTFAR
jgi:hypothetical protein